MLRKEFLEELRIALHGEVSQSEINSQLDYYDKYIMEESRKNKSEQQIIDSLGNPRLIAKTIIDTSDHLTETESNHYHHANKDKRKQNSNSWFLKLIPIFILIIMFIILSRLVVLFFPLLLFIIITYVIKTIANKNKK